MWNQRRFLPFKARILGGECSQITFMTKIISSEELEFQDWKETVNADIQQDVNDERAQQGPPSGG